MVTYFLISESESDAQRGDDGDQSVRHADVFTVLVVVEHGEGGVEVVVNVVDAQVEGKRAALAESCSQVRSNVEPVVIGQLGIVGGLEEHVGIGIGARQGLNSPYKYKAFRGIRAD